jgi:hypothetical protein
MHLIHLFIRITIVAAVFFISAPTTLAQDLMLDITKQEISCVGMEDGRAIVVATGGQGPYEYLWSTGSTEQIINDLAPGTYTVTVTDSAGNTAVDAAGLFDVQAINLSLTKMDGFCGSLGEAAATISGGFGPFQYNWSNGDLTNEITDLAQGTYAITVTDRNACPVVDSIEVIVNGEIITLDSDFSKPSCVGDADGYIAVSQTGAALPVTYQWSNGETNPSIENLTAGTYSVFITDANGCSDGLVVILTDPDAIEVELINQNDALFAVVEGGTPNYDYQWSTGESTVSINNLAPGDYSLTVEDALGCSGFGMAEVLGPLNASSFDNSHRFSISPTLVTQELNVDIQLYSAEDIQLQIIDPLGRKIWEQQFFTLDQSLSLSIPSEWNAGMYFLVLRGQSGLRSTKRFLKN